MKTSRFLGLLLLPLLAPAVVAASAGAAAPPSTVVPIPGLEDVAPGEVVHSWALAPAGSNEVNGNGGRADLSYTADPGSTIDDAVTLYNFGTEQLTFRVYATDAFNNVDGTFDLLPGDQEPTDVGSWVGVEQELISVPPGQQATIPIMVTIPPDAAPGDHVGGVVASSPTFGPGPTGDLVEVDRRIGTRLYVRVNGPISADLAVADVSTDYSHSVNPFAGTATVTFTIQNRGNVRMGSTAEVSVGGPFGIGRQSVEIDDLPELLPGERATRTVTLDDVPAGVINTTKVEVTPLDDELGTPTSSSTRTFAPPIGLLVLVLALVLAALGLRAYQRRTGADSDTLDDVDEDEREPQVTR